MFIYNSYANNNKKALMTLKQRICWQTPCCGVTGTCQLMIMRKLHRSLRQVHFKRLHNDTHTCPAHCKVPTPKGWGWSLPFGICPRTERYRYVYRPIPTPSFTSSQLWPWNGNKLIVNHKCALCYVSFLCRCIFNAKHKDTEALWEQWEAFYQPEHSTVTACD